MEPGPSVRLSGTLDVQYRREGGKRNQWTYTFELMEEGGALQLTLYYAGEALACYAPHRVMIAALTGGLIAPPEDTDELIA